MIEKQVTIQYERKFSDGNFGSEGLSMSLTVDIDAESFAQAANEGVLLLDVLHDRALQLRHAVLDFLGESNAERVRYMANRELNPRPPRQPSPQFVATSRSEPTSDDLESLPF